jgi:hypothetical protein
VLGVHFLRGFSPPLGLMSSRSPAMSNNAGGFDFFATVFIFCLASPDSDEGQMAYSRDVG